MNWDDVSLFARQWMADLGNFSPTVHPEKREVKGWTHDYECGGVQKTYWTSEELRGVARACGEVADWLDKRANEVKP